MIRVTAFIKPHRLEPVKSAIAAVGVSGMSVGDVRGCGNSPEDSSVFDARGVFALPIRARIEVVAAEELAELLVEAIRSSAHTGDSDDGKIFLERVSGAIRVRTGERGHDAL
jgi:nitrogen regulatory protein P-II 1